MSKIWTWAGLLTMYLAGNLWLRSAGAPFSLGGIDFKDINNAALVPVVGIPLLAPLVIFLGWLTWFQRKHSVGQSPAFRLPPLIEFQGVTPTDKTLDAVIRSIAWCFFLLMPTACLVHMLNQFFDLDVYSKSLGTMVLVGDTDAKPFQGIPSFLFFDDKPIYGTLRFQNIETGLDAFPKTNAWINLVLVMIAVRMTWFTFYPAIKAFLPFTGKRLVSIIKSCFGFKRCSN